MKNKNFFPPKEGITEIAEKIKEMLVKNKISSPVANAVKKALIGFFVDNCGAWGLCCEEVVLRELEGLNEAFGSSPKQFKKQIEEMIARERAEREELFSTSMNGKELRKSFDSFDII